MAMFRHRHNKTPANPSRSATARVKNPMPAPTVCPHCAGAVRVASHVEIYGQDYGDWPWAYLCDGCGAYVGMHPFTAIPLGTLAGAELRKARCDCKPPFERIWQSQRMTRREAYAALAIHMEIPENECHFGLFDVARCEIARAWALSIITSKGS